jgi:hypothetical protein
MKTALRESLSLLLEGATSDRKKQGALSNVPLGSKLYFAVKTDH